jgi:hypothetical protein
MAEEMRETSVEDRRNRRRALDAMGIRERKDAEMKEGLSEIVCIIDRSGSMGSIRDDAIGGFNTFLAEQKKLPGEATLTYIQFDTEYEVVHENAPLNDVPPIDETVYVPRGSTALLDAVGRTIDATGKRLANMPEEHRPETVIVAILEELPVQAAILTMEISLGHAASHSLSLEQLPNPSSSMVASMLRARGRPPAAPGAAEPDGRSWPR